MGESATNHRLSQRGARQSVALDDVGWFTSSFIEEAIPEATPPSPEILRITDGPGALYTQHLHLPRPRCGSEGRFLK